MLITLEYNKQMFLYVMYQWQTATYSNSIGLIHFSWQSERKPFFQLRTLFSNDGGWGWYAGGTSWLPSVKALPFSQICLYHRFDILRHWDCHCKQLRNSKM